MDAMERARQLVLCLMVPGVLPPFCARCSSAQMCDACGHAVTRGAYEIAAAITEAVAEARAALLSDVAIEAASGGCWQADEAAGGKGNATNQAMAKAALESALRATDSPERSGAVTPARRENAAAGSESPGLATGTRPSERATEPKEVDRG